MLEGILPLGSDGLIVVFSDDCEGSVFSFRLDGPAVIYLGGGDLHDDNYDYLGKSLTVLDAMDTTKRSAEGSSYTGLPLSETQCVRTISIYPSKAMEDNHVTKDPLVFTLAALAIFVFTSTIFILYDCTVAR